MSESMDVLMECGCRPMTRKGPGMEPYCFTHDCGDVMEDQPNLEGRMARCDYYGGKPSRNECDGCKGKDVCGCEMPSSIELAFFVHQPNEDFDRFYCGCHSWN